jgi:hypothetical protein
VERHVELYGIPSTFFDVADPQFLTIASQESSADSIGTLLYGFDRRIVLSSNDAEALNVAVGDSVMVEGAANGGQIKVILIHIKLLLAV